METFYLWEKVPGMCEEAPALDFYPTVRPYAKATVVICPGGAYSHLARHEGEGYAQYFNTIGMHAFVCRYRVYPHQFPLPLLDIRRAIRFVRANSEKFGIDPEQVAVMGSSAGGHLAALVSTYMDPISFEGVDEIDLQPFLPNATILCYPVCHCPDELEIAHEGSFRNLLPPELWESRHAFSCDEIVSDSTPPAFLWHTAEDGGVSVINSYLYAAALRKQNIPHELHVFPAGGHGLGLAPQNPHVAQWAPLMRNWLAFMGWIPG